MTTATFDNNKLANVALSSDTALGIFDDCSKRKRMRWETDLGRYAVKLAKKGVKVVQEPYMQTWKDLEDFGVGVIVHGRNGNPTRFRWHYSLKDIGEAAMHPEKKIEFKMLEGSTKQEPKEVKVKRGRPFGSKNKKKVKLIAKAPNEVIQKIAQVTKLLQEIAKLSA